MAAPVDASRTNGGLASAASLVIVDWSGLSVAVGDLLLILMRIPSSAVIQAGSATGWSRLVDGASPDAADDTMTILWKIADATDVSTGQVTLTFSTSAKCAFSIRKITGAATTGHVVSAASIGTAANLNPASFSPGSTKDWLYVSFIGLDGETQTFSAVPSGYSNQSGDNSGTTGAVATNCIMSSASKGTTASSSEDPGAWTHAAPNSGVSAYTIAIAPGGKTGTSSARGGGSLTASSLKGAAGTSTEGGGGSLTASSRKAALSTSTARGGGAATSSGQKDTFAKTGTSSVRGGGSLAGTSAKSSSGSSSVRGGGTLIASSRKAATGVSSVRGGGGSVGAGREGALQPTAVSGGGLVASAVRKNASGASSVRGGGGLAGSGSQLQARSGSSSVRGGGAASSSTRKVAAQSSSVRGGGSATSSGFGSVPRFGTSAVRGGGALIATTRRAGYAVSTVTGAGRLALVVSSARFAATLVSGGGLARGTAIAGQPAAPAETWRTGTGNGLASTTKSSLRVGRTRTSADSGVTLSSVPSGRTRRGG